ncbi:MAG: TetR family transcriptional regulator [Pseudomonadota bacterium]
MTKTLTARERLLAAARALFWTRGYSNVSVRDIAADAGVDAALVSRYFGGKQALFEATLDEIPVWDALTAEGPAVLEKAVESFSHPFDPETEAANPFSLLLANIIDPEMGDRIRAEVADQIAGPLAARLGNAPGHKAQDRAAMLLAVLFGMALMRKNFQLEALGEKSTEELAAMIRALGRAALDYKP